MCIDPILQGKVTTVLDIKTKTSPFLWAYICEKSKIFSSCFLKELEKHYRDFNIRFLRPYEKFTSWAAQHSTRLCASSLQYQWVLLFSTFICPSHFFSLCTSTCPILSLLPCFLERRSCLISKCQIPTGHLTFISRPIFF